MATRSFKRRPHIGELDRLEVKDIRPFVQKGQAVFELATEAGQPPTTLQLLWLERWGGTFGPKSSAEANRNRSVPSLDRLLNRAEEQSGERPSDPERTADRGQVPAWLLYLACPDCGKRCRRLYSLKGHHDYGCHKCVNPQYEGCRNRPSGMSNDKGSARERARLKHRRRAEVIRREYLLQTEPSKALITPLASTIPKPPRMTVERYQALCRLAEAHETLAMVHMMGAVSQTLASLSKEVGIPAPDSEGHKMTAMVNWANRVLVVDAWALRQRSWHRRGKPRDTPGEGTRAALARLETSKDSSSDVGPESKRPQHPPVHRVGTGAEPAPVGSTKQERSADSRVDLAGG